MTALDHGITQAKGFTANGIWCGLKRSGNEDLSLIYSEVPAVAACVYTKNSVVAAPLIVCKKHLRNNTAQAIVINSGNANCFTGDQGYDDAKQMTIQTAKKLGVTPGHVLVASTGIIGQPLRMDKISEGIEPLVDGLDKSGFRKCARGILTTDTVIKQKAVEFKIGSKTVTVGGCAKGSGMIAPNMATMLGFITTDVAITPKMLKLALKKATEESFNCITVDGCMSTNDMVAVLANGQADNDPIESEGESFDRFYFSLREVCVDISRKIVLDGEGASKFVEINVLGARTYKQAKEVGLVVANSMLVKTAVAGSNPNWGRVAAAVGSLGIKYITERNLDISFSSFDKEEIQINIKLNAGQAKATVYTSDLSYEYVRINMEYN